MVSLLSRGVGLLVKSLAGLSCTQATRCSSLPGALSTVQCSATRWFSKQHSLDDHPKRPLTSYLRFVSQQWPMLMKQYPEAKLLDITKMIALEWRGLSEASRKPYVEVANEEWLKYKNEVRKFREKLTPLELELLKEKKKQKMVKRKHLRLRREMTLLGKPKGPRNSYNIFLSENFHEAKGTSISEKMKSLYEDWKVLPHSQKQIYVHLAQDDKIRYENEMKIWEEQMLEIGREDLVRSKARKRLLKDSAVMYKAKSRKELAKKLAKPAGRAVEADTLTNEE